MFEMLFRDMTADYISVDFLFSAQHELYKDKYRKQL